MVAKHDRRLVNSGAQGTLRASFVARTLKRKLEGGILRSFFGAQCERKLKEVRE